MFGGWQSPTHLAIVGLLVILLFGAKRLPEVGRSLGLGMREFKDSVTNSAPQAPLELLSGGNGDEQRGATDDESAVTSTSRAS